MVSTRGVKFKYTEGERVLCYEPDPTKAKVLYDSKVLDLVVTRDSKGRKIPEYLVHFYGWNSSWDRCVQEDFVLSDTDENRMLQKRLAEEASVNLKGKKRLHKMGAILKDSIHKRKCPEGTKDIESSSKVGGKWKDSDSSQDDETSDDGMEDDETEEEEDDEGNPFMQLILSDQLKAKLEDDCLNITSHGKLVKIPAELTVVELLENYVKNVGISMLHSSVGNPTGKRRTADHMQHIRVQNKIQLNKEMADGLRVCFDFTLPLALLYRQEQEQYKDVSSKPFVDKPKEISAAQKLINSESTMSLQSAEMVSIRTKDRLQSTSPTHANQTQSKLADTQNLNEVDNGTSPPVNSSRSQIRFTRGNQSPNNTSGDESQRMHRVLRSTERLRLEENQNRKTDLNIESENLSGPDSPTISFKQVPPGSPQLASDIAQSCASSKGEVSSASSSHSDSTIDRSASNVKVIVPDSSGLLQELTNWQLLPAHLIPNQNTQTPPSCVYGAHHLLRLFVKLPGYLHQMNIPKSRRTHLIKHLELFIQYLDEKCDNIFLSSEYVDASHTF